MDSKLKRVWRDPGLSIVEVVVLLTLLSLSLLLTATVGFSVSVQRKPEFLKCSYLHFR